MPTREPATPPWTDPDPVAVMRRAALEDALRPGTSPGGSRPYSTLISASQSAVYGPEGCAFCDSLLGAVRDHLAGHRPIDGHSAAAYGALLVAWHEYLAAAPDSAPCGGGDVVEDQGDGEPATAAGA